MSVAAFLMLSSLIQNAQSGAGALISAFGKASAPSAVLTPLMWSGCKCESTTMSIAFASIPAAARCAWHRPAVGTAPGGKPVERDRDLALRHVGGFCRGERLLLGNVAHEAVRHWGGATAVGNLGQLVIANLVAIEAGRLLAGRWRSGAGGWRHGGQKCRNAGA